MQADFSGIGKATVFPYLSANLQTAERLCLISPFRTNQSGFTWLKPAYYVDSHGKTGINDAHHSYRFFLGEDRSIPSGIGDYETVPMSALILCKFTPQARHEALGGTELCSTNK